MTNISWVKHLICIQIGVKETPLVWQPDLLKPRVLFMKVSQALNVALINLNSLCKLMLTRCGAFPFALCSKIRSLGCAAAGCQGGLHLADPRCVSQHQQSQWCHQGQLCMRAECRGENQRDGIHFILKSFTFSFCVWILSQTSFSEFLH